MEESELDNIRIASPCKVPWDSMKGNDKIRFCSQCSLNVYDLSNMTRKEVAKIFSQNEKLCVALYRRADGTILMQDCPVGLARIKSWCKLTFAIFGAFLTGSILFHSIFRQELQDRFDRQSAFAEARGKKDLGGGLQAKGKVVFCTKFIAAGESIKPENLEEKEVVQSKIPMDALTSASLCDGKISRRSILPGQVLLQHDLLQTYVKSYKLRLEQVDRERIFNIALKKNTTESILLTDWVRQKLHGATYSSDF